VIQRQLGHANLGVTSIYLQGIDSADVIEAVQTRRPPEIPSAAALAGYRFSSKVALYVPRALAEAVVSRDLDREEYARAVDQRSRDARCF
jgi:hypothetical protein